MELQEELEPEELEMRPGVMGRWRYGEMLSPLVRWIGQCLGGLVEAVAETYDPEPDPEAS